MSVDHEVSASPSPSDPDAVATGPVDVEAGSAAPEDNPDYVEPADPSPSDEVERILPSPGEPFALASGTQVVSNPLKLREFLALLKIITHGAAVAMAELRLNTNDEDFANSLLSLFVFAIPEAPEEAADFVRLMVRPAGPFPSDKERIEAQIALDAELDNPDLEDLLTIMEVTVNNEGKDLRRLGKRLTSALAFAQKTGQL